MRLQKTYTSERDLKKCTEDLNARDTKGSDRTRRKDQSYLSFVNSATFLKLNQTIKSASNNRLAGMQSSSSQKRTS